MTWLFILTKLKTVAEWFWSTKAGRYTAIAIAAVAGIAYVFYRGRKTGQEDVKKDLAENEAEVVERIRKVEGAISRENAITTLKEKGFVK